MAKQVVPVSVVIPCYLCAETIGRAVDSVAAQTVLPAEVWLIEDGSPDEGRTLEKLREMDHLFGSSLQISVIAFRENRGAGAARNAGWNASSQPFIAFLDADDSWHPSKLEIQSRWMIDHPDVAMTGHGWHWVRSPDLQPTISNPTRSYRVSKLRQLVSNRFFTPTVMLRRDLPYRFVESRWTGTYVLEDIELWLRIVLSNHQTWRLESGLTYIHKAPFGDGGLSGNLWRMERSQIRAHWLQVIERRLPIWAFLLVLPWSLFKFILRLIMVASNRRPEYR